MDKKDIRVGMRVALYPATDLWMRGVRYGDVVKVGRIWIHVEANGHVWRILPQFLDPAS